MSLRGAVVCVIEDRISESEAAAAYVCYGLLESFFDRKEDSILEATKDELEDFLYSRGISESSVTRRLSTLINIYDVLVERRIICENPARAITRPKICEKVPFFEVSIETIDAVIQYQRTRLATCGGAVRRMEMLTLAILEVSAAGAFCGEFRDVTVGDLADSNITLGKQSGRERMLWLSGDAMEAVTCSAFDFRDRSLGPRERLWLTTRNKLLCEQSVWHHIKRAIRQAGLANTGLKPSHFHRGALKRVVRDGLGWDTARLPGGYRRIPRSKVYPSLDEIELAIQTYHPLA